MKEKGKFGNFTKNEKRKVSFANFDAKFEHLLIGILKKGKHFQLTVFSADFKSAIKTEINAL